VVPNAAFCQACGAELSRVGPSSAAPAPPAHLVVIAQDGTAEREYPFDGGQLDIGRLEGNVVLADDAYVCPRHARILWKNGQFWITDLGSVNGVYQRIRAAEPLQHGDLVLLGLEVLRFELVNVDEQAQVAAVERGTRLFGSPAAPRYARLVQRTVEGVSRNVYYLSHTKTAIGRESGDIVFTDDPFMSRQHATITRQYDGSFMLADAGSSNGSFLSIRNQRPLNDGDDVRIGQHLFRLKVRA
jgi:pSer/pThr/pTyr-binding forkhead associated (FHA) protein